MAFVPAGVLLLPFSTLGVAGMLADNVTAEGFYEN